MKKSVLNAYECKVMGLNTFGNHQVKNLGEARPVSLISDSTLEPVDMVGDRVFYFFNNPVAVGDSQRKVFRLSHAGVYANDKVTGEPIVGIWPKTTTQTLMMYRDLFCGEGYTEIEPIEGRGAIDWRAHMEEYNERKAMIKAGIVPPRKTRTKKAKLNQAMLDLLVGKFGLDPQEVLASMNEKNAEPAPALPAIIPDTSAEPVKLTVTNVDYIGGRPLGVLLDIMHDTLCVKGEHADLKWWEENLPSEKVEAQEEKTESSDLKEEGVTVVDADYIAKLQAEAEKEKAQKKTKATKKATTKKTTKKSTAKKNTKKEAVA